MNKLIFSNVYLWENHLAEMLEIFMTQKEKSKIFLLTCNEYFDTCPANLLKKKSICKKCLIQKKYVTKDLISDQFINIELNNNKTKNLIPNFHKLEEFVDYKYENFLPAGQFAVSTLLSQTKDLFVPFEDMKKTLYDYANNSINFYQDCLKIIDQYEIDETYTWNGRRISDGPLSFAAKKKGKIFYSYISGGNTNSYILQPTEGIHDLNYTKKRIEKFYQSNLNNLDNYTKLGSNYFKFMRYGGDIKYGMFYFNEFFNDKLKIESKNKSNKKKLSIFTSSEWEYFALVGSEWRFKNGIEINQYKTLRKILNDKEIIAKYEIFVRWHPYLNYAGENEKKEIQKIIKDSNLVTHFDYTSKINSYKLIEKSDVVLSFGSQIGVEATYYEKPSICFGTAYYEDTGAVYNCINTEELKKILFLKNLKPLPKINAIKFGFHEEFKGEKKFIVLKRNKNHSWFLNNKRILYLSNFDKKIYYLKLILKKLNLYYLTRKVLYALNILKTKSYQPKSWINK